MQTRLSAKRTGQRLIPIRQQKKPTPERGPYLVLFQLVNDWTAFSEQPNVADVGRIGNIRWRGKAMRTLALILAQRRTAGCLLSDQLSSSGNAVQPQPIRLMIDNRPKLGGSGCAGLFSTLLSSQGEQHRVSAAFQGCQSVIRRMFPPSF
ncbi:hypothetical protein [Aquamicrobium ahrensii]|uniref:Transposase n=1 Tax=Aquamicrobium ahrensii TaxID=469551 RepID=A0ABV2KKZ1_9HYPH